MTFECQILRDASNGQACVRCGKTEGVVDCHYTGVRRHAYGGGYGKKVHDFLIADLCQECHVYMDTISRERSQSDEQDKDGAFLHSEEFLHFVVLTLERRFVQGVIVVKGMRAPRIEKLSKLVPRRTA